MQKLIEALQIFAKYTDSEYDVVPDHEVLYVNVDPEKVTEEDKNRLKELDFSVNIEGIFFKFM